MTTSIVANRWVNKKHKNVMTMYVMTINTVSHGV